jgi:P-type Ca2+ transporter type 2C
VVEAIHTAVRGRARYRVGGLYRSEGLRQYLADHLRQDGEVYSFSVNILTGNVLIRFNGHRTTDELGTLLQNLVRNFEEHSGTREARERKAGLYPVFFPPAQYGNLKSEPSGTEPRHPLAPVFSQKTKTSPRKVRRLVVHSEDQPDQSWHLLEAHDLLERLDSHSALGLSRKESLSRLKTFGPNVLPESVPRSGFGIFIDQFKSLPVALLGVAAGISLATAGIADAVVIAAVVLINAVIGYVTESQAERTINSLKTLVRPHALVVRDGAAEEIPAEEVVPGDVLVLRPGTYVTADARLIEAHHLTIDESALTGESLPVSKTTERILIYEQVSDRGLPQMEVPLGDRTNMVYMGTLVTGGQGLALVVATGRFTEIGRIQILVGESQTPETPMEKQLNAMGTQLVLISGAVCGLVFVIGLLRGYGFLQMLKSSISLAVAAVPEGLPTVATTTLGLGLRRMRKYNVLIRHLEAVETLGSVQTICMDKTGTLTMNRMSVVMINVGMRRILLEKEQFKQGQEVVNPYVWPELLQLMHIAILCNESEVTPIVPDADVYQQKTKEVQGKGLAVFQNGNVFVSGSPTENALIHMALAAGVNIPNLREQFPLEKTALRTETRNYMITLHRTSRDGQRVAAVKGSPPEILALCDFWMRDGERLPLTEEDRLELEMENERLAGKALRVLAVAYAQLSDGVDFLEDPDVVGGLTWLGLVGMGDPVRDGVKELIAQFHTAGIDTVMITGDQAATAYAIGRSLQLNRTEDLEILDSSNLAAMQADLLEALAEKVQVFARVSPAHKLQIVQALQRAGRVVAMTGDGINDGPALKVADIGVAMGKSGTDVAREVADVVLEDDRLETMIIAVKQGRTIYNNIRKSIHFLLATNMSEIMVVFTSLAAGLGEPLNAMQLLWINLISDIFPGLALALELPEPDVLTRPPRDPGEPIVRREDFKKIMIESGVMSVGAMTAYGYGLVRYGQGSQASTLAFMSLSIGQLLHAFSCRSDRLSIFSKEKLPPNPLLTQAIAGSLLLQGATLFVPGLSSLMQITPLGIFDGLVIAGTAVAPLLINETIKMSKEAP